MKALTPDQHSLLLKLVELTSRGEPPMSLHQLASLMKRGPSSVARQMKVLVTKGYLSADRFPLEVLVAEPPEPQPIRKKAARWSVLKDKTSFPDGVYSPKRSYLRGDAYTTHNGHTVVLAERKGPRKLGPGKSSYYWTALTWSSMRRVSVTEVSLDCRFSPVT